MKRLFPLLLLVSGCNLLLHFDVPSPPPTLLTYTTPVTYTMGRPIDENRPSYQGGPPDLYAVSPELPPGLSLDKGIISGIPTAPSPEAGYTVTATNSGGSTTATLIITVKDVPPSLLSYSSNSATYTKGQVIPSNTPSSSGGAVVSYSINPPLPVGLTLNTTTGVITGTPTVLSPATAYTVTATNSGGSTTATLTLTANDVPPSLLSYSSNSATYPKGQVIPGNTPSSSGGAVVSYSISPPLPAGLALNTTTGVITGTPTVLSPATAYTVTATNSGGPTTATLTIAVDDVPPSISYASAAYTKGQVIPSNTPSSSGGAVVSYSINPPLPVGLTLNTTTGVITVLLSVVDEGSAGEIDPVDCRVAILRAVPSPSWAWIPGRHVG